MSKCSDLLTLLTFNVHGEMGELTLPLPSNIFTFINDIRIYLNAVIVFLKSNMHLLQMKTYYKAPLVEAHKAWWPWLRCDGEGEMVDLQGLSFLQGSP